MTRTEGAGLRTRTVYKIHENSLRAKILAFYAAKPNNLLTREEIMDRFGVRISGVKSALNRLKRDAHIVSLCGPGRTVYYGLPGVSTEMIQRPARKPATEKKREWPEGSHYTAPKPIATSVWDLGRML